MRQGAEQCEPVVMHVIQPFPVQGNTMVTVTSELTRAYAKQGGTSAVILTTSRELHVPNARNISVDYRMHCPKERFSGRQLYTDFAAAQIGFRRPFAGKLLLPAVRAVEQVDPDVILLYEGYYALPSLPIWREALPNTPVLLYVHTSFSRSYSRAEIRRSLGAATAAVFVSSALKRSVVKRLGASPCPMEVVENGVDVELFSPALKGSKGSANIYKVLFVGAVTPHKGVDRLVRAVAHARRHTERPVRLQVVGSSAYNAADALTEYERGLRQTASGLGVDVVFTPFVSHEDLPAVYQDADLLCMPSLNEDPYPLVILEAMACGLPVIASGRGGTREAGGEHAIYVDPDDTEAFAGAIADLANDPAKAAERGAACRRWAELHSWSDTMQRLLALAR
ncbi:MAG: glycosyltransferase family 4 protein [Deltaproteobacteria bacterium]